MKAIQLFAKVSVFGFILFLPSKNVAANTNTNTTAIIGQWDFDNGDLRATVGQPIQFLNGATTSSATVFTSLPINGTNAAVLNFPAANTNQGYIVSTGGLTN